MKNFKISLLALILMAGVNAQAATDIMKDFDSLGGNDVLLQKARALNPQENVGVVQDRVVTLRNRFEIAPEFGDVMGGDAYDSTQNIGMNMHYHITPQWSVGAKYAYMTNHLRPEGEWLLQDRSFSDRGIVPYIDYPKSEMLGLVNWYPIYGKMNLYDLGVVHFDVYALLGAGTIELNSGNTTTYTAGGGIGFWVSQHLTTRLEMRYQNYNAKNYDGAGTTGMNLTVAGIQIGYLL